MEKSETAKTTDKRPCRKCLLKDLDREEYFENLYAYIRGLDEDIKAAPELVEERLDTCRRCDYLLEGMCRACGCFVELRSAIAGNRCPYAKW